MKEQDIVENITNIENRLSTINCRNHFHFPIQNSKKLQLIFLSAIDLLRTHHILPHRQRYILVDIKKVLSHVKNQTGITDNPNNNYENHLGKVFDAKKKKKNIVV